MHNSKGFIIVLSILLFGNTAWSQNPKVELPGTQVIKFTSAINNQDYELYIELPGGYSDTTTRYPVLYALDGISEFPLVSAINGALAYDGFIPGMILVGIGWKGDWDSSRQRDFSSASVTGDPGLSGASKFLNVIKKEIFRLIDSNFRTNGKNNTLYGGSLGGFFALYSLFHEPSLFNRYIVCSPSLQYDNEITFKYEKSFAEKNHILNAKILISSSEVEEELFPESNFKKFISQLRASKYTGLELDTLVVAKMSHSSEGPYAIGRGLQFVFSKPDLTIDTLLLDQYAGRYDQNWLFTRTGNSLYVNVFGGKVKLCAETNTSFYVNGMHLLCDFKKDNNKVSGCDFTFFSNKTIFLKKVSTERHAIQLDAKKLDLLKGKYDFGGGIFVWVTVENNKLYIKLPHPEKLEIFPEDELNFFSKSVDVTIEFKKDKGKVSGMIINEGVRNEGKKIE